MRSPNLSSTSRQHMAHLQKMPFIPVDNPNPELRGRRQVMVFPSDLPPHHPDFAFRGQAKGMHRVLEERGLISVLQAVNGGKAVGECQTCKLSREAQDQMRREAQAAAEGGDEPGESNFDIVQESLRIN